jgi:hypothetical protein
MSRIDMLAVGLCMAFGYGLVTWLLSLKKPDSLKDGDLDSHSAVPQPAVLSAAPWWQVLGVLEDASQAQIEEAYHAKLRQYALTSEDGVGSALVQLAQQQTRLIEAAYLQALKPRKT